MRGIQRLFAPAASGCVWVQEKAVDAAVAKIRLPIARASYMKERAEKRLWLWGATLIRAPKLPVPGRCVYLTESVTQPTFLYGRGDAFIHGRLRVVPSTKTR